MENTRGTTWIVRTSDHRSHYITGAIPSRSEDDIRLHVYNEVVETKDREIYISNATIIMSRTAAVKLIEAVQGALQSDPERITKVISVPKEAALSMEDARTDARKKVQKIRVK